MLVGGGTVVNPDRCRDHSRWADGGEFSGHRHISGRVETSDSEMTACGLDRDPFYGEWNHTLVPRALPDEAVIGERTLGMYLRERPGQYVPALYIPWRMP